ncbi:glycoside hydrolase family 3 protein [Algoriphagus sp.]|uniref:glycoside hydrolase family 3 protein n=1 Tax=Algoriphagus sp. TaxID=1872435 RepID=UPI002715D2B4|nr:glycoside hydrolase family 3 N-terminal domain-containing protein [Algoriphagus sp.]MDO8965295.1 glycoside hydrolase family 3 N-terminal domain-containing protein [Algoriphagus sp.]MDP3198727.1 glycoside hydrolase family 3 N-terminal domain-containing protein [Algoriphagus sp.]
MNRKQKIAQCFSPAAFIHDTEENHQAIEKLIQEQEIGGLTFFHSRHSAAANFEKRAEVLEVTGTFEKMIGLINRYQTISKVPLLISIDGEYGLAMRVEKTPQYPFAITLGALKNDAETQIKEVGYRMGFDMKRSGIHLNLAPCADVNTNPNNPVIGYRSFGNQAKNVAKLSFAAYTGMKKAGIGACLKHFPGHGDTEVDSHLGLPILNKTKAELQTEELFPFQYGIDRGVEMIMVGHLAVPALTGGKDIPASISRELITDLLKGEMGFKGLVISDALNMKAVANLFPEPGDLEWEAFLAGNDILCFSDHVKEGIEKIAQNSSDAEVHAVFEKVMDLKKRLEVLETRPIDVPTFDWERHSKLQKDLAENYISVISGEIKPKELQALAEGGKLGYQEFFTSGKSHFAQKLEIPFASVEQAEKVILTVFVPSHKPLNQFGMEQTVLDEIKELAKSKPCFLIHFGNPLALKHLGNPSDFEAVICGYQGFEEVQELVAKLFFEC